MKLKIVVMFFLMCILLITFTHAVVVQHGVLKIVLSDIRIVTIDQTRYQVAQTTKLFRQSEPDIDIPLSADLEGSRVRFDAHDNVNPPVLVYMVILDN